MSVKEINVVDSMALTNYNHGIAMLLFDDLNWSEEEYHLTKLQDKINNYVTFLAGKQYKNTYKDAEITYGIIGKQLSNLVIKLNHSMVKNK